MQGLDTGFLLMYVGSFCSEPPSCSSLGLELYMYVCMYVCIEASRHSKIVSSFLLVYTLATLPDQSTSYLLF